MRAFCAKSAVCAMIVLLTIACGDASGPPPQPASIVIVSGDAQASVQVGAKLPLPLTAKVLDANGRPLSGITVTWNTTSGTLSTTSSVTDGNGLASAEWTLGTAAGPQTATAKVSGKSAVFKTLAVAGPLAQIVLSRATIRLLGIGDSFRLNARAVDQYGNTVAVETVVESADTSVVTADNFGNGAILTAHASDKTVILQATAGMIVKTATVIVLPPPCQSG